MDGTHTDRLGTPLTLEELVRIKNELMINPGQQLRAILVTDKDIPEYVIFKTEYEDEAYAHGTYLLVHKKTIERMAEQAKRLMPFDHIDERYELPAGQIGLVSGIPILMDREGVTKMLIHLFRESFRRQYMADLEKLLDQAFQHEVKNNGDGTFNHEFRSPGYWTRDVC